MRLVQDALESGGKKNDHRYRRSSDPPPESQNRVEFNVSVQCTQQMNSARTDCARNSNVSAAQAAQVALQSSEPNIYGNAHSDYQKPAANVRLNMVQTMFEQDDAGCRNKNFGTFPAKKRPERQKNTTNNDNNNILEIAIGCAFRKRKQTTDGNKKARKICAVGVYFAESWQSLNSAQIIRSFPPDIGRLRAFLETRGCNLALQKLRTAESRRFLTENGVEGLRLRVSQKIGLEDLAKTWRKSNRRRALLSLHNAVRKLCRKLPPVEIQVSPKKLRFV